MNNKNTQVVTWYSYKGGAGRSLTLANVAYELCLTNKEVFIIDSDLHAAGIHYKLATTPAGEDALKQHPFGLINLLYNFKEKIMDTTDELAPAQGDSYEQKRDLWFSKKSGTSADADGMMYYQLSDYAMDIIDMNIFDDDADMDPLDRVNMDTCVHEFKMGHIQQESISMNKTGRLRYITAGNIGNFRQLWHGLSTLDLADVYNKDQTSEGAHPLSLVHCLEWLIAYIKKKYQPDYIFIDSRAGFTPLGRWACSQLSDQVFLFMTNIPESFEGISHVYYDIYKSRYLTGRETEVKFVFSRMPGQFQDEDKPLDIFNYTEGQKVIEEFKQRLERTQENIQAENQYLFGSFLQVEERQAYQAFKSDLAHLTPDKVLAIRACAELERNEYLALANISFNPGYAGDLFEVFTSIIGYNFGSMYAGLDTFINNYDFYFNKFFQYAQQNPDAERYLGVLRFYTQSKRPKDFKFFTAFTQYIDIVSQAAGTNAVDPDYIEAFISIMEQISDGVGYRYPLSQNLPLIGWFDTYLNQDGYHNLRMRWFNVKIKEKSSQIFANSVSVLEAYIEKHILKSSTSRQAVYLPLTGDVDKPEVPSEGVSDKEKKMYVTAYLEAVFRYGNDAFHMNYDEPFINSASSTVDVAYHFENRPVFILLEHYCMLYPNELEPRYYLANVKIRQKSDEGGHLTSYLKSDERILNVLIRIKGDLFFDMLTLFASDETTDDYAIYLFIKKLHDTILADPLAIGGTELRIIEQVIIRENQKSQFGKKKASLRAVVKQLENLVTG